MSRDQQWNALKRIIRRLPAQSMYYASALGAIVLAGGGQLPPGLEFVAGGIGANILSNLIDEIARGEDILDDDVRTRAEEAIQRSDITNLLTKQDFLQGYARLIRRLDAQKEISKEILNELHSGFDKVATADQVAELKALILNFMEHAPQQSVQKSRVFISYARADDEPFVEKLYNDLKDEIDVWWDRISMPNRGLTFLQEIRDAIDHADRLLLVAGPGAFTSDYVRDEWQYAYKTYKGINIALRLGDYPDLPEQLSGFDAPNFRNNDDYDERLATLKRQLAEPIAPVGKHFSVPAKPEPFLDRPDVMETLHNLVIADVDKPTLISVEKRITIIEGMGGIGKSAIATIFAHDRKVRFAFPDGIVWLTTGHKPSMYELYRAVGIALGDDLSNYPDETTARQNAQKSLAEKKCLLILDDVWELPIGRAFRDLISGTSARLLITTRNLQIKDVLNANDYRLKLIDESQAADYLRSWVGDDPDLEAISKKLGYLFLALKLAGARMKKDGISGGEYLRTFDRVSRMKINRQASDREDSLEASIMLSVDAVFVNAESEKLLYYTFGIFPEDAPIPEKTILQLWKHLRPATDEFDLLETLNTLVDLALVNRHEDRTLTLHDLILSYAREKLGGRYVRTHHDLLDSYNPHGIPWDRIIDDNFLYNHLIYHLHNARRIDDIHKLFADDRWLHARLQGNGHGYGDYVSDLMITWEQHAHKEALQQLSSPEECTALPQCIRYSLIRTTINSLARNYNPALIRRAIELEIWSVQRAIELFDLLTFLSEKVELLLSVFKVTNHEPELSSTLSDKARETIYSIYKPGGLGGQDPDVFENIAELCLYTGGKELHIGFLLALNHAERGELHDETLPARLIHEMSDEERTVYLELRFESILAIRAPSTRATILLGIFQHLSEQQKSMVVDNLCQESLQLRDVYSIPCFAPLFEHLSIEESASSVDHFIELLKQSEDSSRVADSIVSLAEYLNTQQLQDVLDFAPKIKDTRSRVRALKTLFKHLPPTSGETQDTRELTITLKDQYNPFDYLDLMLILADIDPDTVLLNSEQIAQAAIAILELNIGTLHFETILDLVPFVDKESNQAILRTALEQILQINDEDDYYRGKNLELLLPFLDEELVQIGLNKSLSIDDGDDLVAALTSIALKIPTNKGQRLIDEALSIAFTLPISYSYSKPRVKAFHYLASYMNESEKLKALELLLEIPINQIESQVSYFRTLLHFAEIDKTLIIERYFELVGHRNYNNEYSRIVELAVPFLDQDQIDKTKKLALEMNDLGDRFEILIHLIDTLSADERDSICEFILNQITHISDRKDEDHNLYKKYAGSNKDIENTLATFLEDTSTDLELIRLKNPGMSSITSEYFPKLLPYCTSAYVERFSQQILSLSNIRTKINLFVSLSQHTNVTVPNDFLVEALDDALKQEDPLDRTWTLIDLLQNLSNEHAEVAINESLKSTKIIENEQLKSWTVANLAHYLPDEYRDNVVREAFQFASHLDLSSTKTRIIVQLIPHLHYDDLLKSVDIALELSSYRNRWAILDKVLPLLKQDSGVIQQIIATELEDLLGEANSSRSSVLQAIAKHNTFSPPYISEELLLRIGEHIVDIYSNWTWK